MRYPVLYCKIMDLTLTILVILFASGCDSGVVRQFTFDHTDHVDTDIEKISNNAPEITNHSTFESSEIPTTETSITAVDDHNLTVSIVGFRNISHDMNTTKDQVSGESHNILNNHTKDFNRSQQSLSKGSGRLKKKHLKGSSRFRNGSPKETKHIVKDSFHIDHLNKSHHSKELSHPDKEAAQISHHAANVTLEHLIDGSDHSESLENKSNQFDNDGISVTHHTDINLNIRNDHDESHIDDIVKNVSNFSEQSINGSNENNFLSHKTSNFDHFDNETHQVAHNISAHFENLLDVGSDIPTVHDTMEMVETSNQPSVNLETKDETSDSSLEIHDHFNFNETNHPSVSEEFNNIEHNSSDLTNFHKDVNTQNNTAWANLTHSENPTAEVDIFNQIESFHSSEIELKDKELEGQNIDIEIINPIDNSSDIFLNLTIFEQHLKESNQADSILVNHHINETVSEDVYVMFTVTPVEDEANSSTELFQEIQDVDASVENLEMNKSESNMEVSDPNIKVAEENSTGSLFSGINFDFLTNSELAKNAAGAMEVFNFTDLALTDHIVDDNNDVHDFLDLIHSPVDNLHDSKPNLSPDQESNFSTPWNNNTDLETVTDGIQNIKDQDHVNESEIVGNETDMSTLKDDGLEVTTIISQPLLNSTVVFEETSEVSQPMQSSTVVFEETTVNHSTLNSTVEFVDDAVCPPPGICIFWFLAQDTCAVNSHCLGSRICCRIGCAKTCIEV